MKRLRRLVTTLAMVTVAVTGSTGCGGDVTAFAEPVDPESLYWRLRLDQHAVQLSLAVPASTLQLTATMQAPSGAAWVPRGSLEEAEALLAAYPAVWTSSDSARVHVSSNGLVTARGVTTSIVRIIVRRQIRNVTKVDTAQVRVVAEVTPKEFAVLKARPAAPDSAKVAVSSSKAFSAVTLASNGDTLKGVATYYTTSDTTIAKFANAWAGTITGRRRGSTLVTATTWIYGVAKTDTFTLVVGAPLTAFPTMTKRAIAGSSLDFYLSEPTSDIGPGGVVAFVNYTGGLGQPGQPIDILFDNPAVALPSLTPSQNSGGGNVLQIPSDTTFTSLQLVRYRRFLDAGTYPYTVMPYGVKGTVIVRPQ